LANFDYILLVGMIIFVLLILFISQFYYLLKIKKILNQLTKNSDYYLKIFNRIGNPSQFSKKQNRIPQTCQFCRYRISYIHMGNTENTPEDFYYKCRLNNISIKLNDYCNRFDNESQG
jgi:L-ribulose-5-phosphate 3-epimerase UlaE